MDSRVFVGVRIRPKLDNNTGSAGSAARNAAAGSGGLIVQERYSPEVCQKVSDGTIRLSEMRGKDTKNFVFAFDRVFDKEGTQEELYEDAALESVDAALAGANATIMTYGQTGSGKTYTVLGSIKANPLGGVDDIMTVDTGMFLRVLKDLLEYRNRKSDKHHLMVCLSVVEIYRDTLRDLLSKDMAQLKCVLDDTTVYLPDLNVREIRSLKDAVDCYKMAMGRRVTRETGANDASSRSHAVFTIDIFQMPKKVTGASGEVADVVFPSVEFLVSRRDYAVLNTAKQSLKSAKSGANLMAAAALQGGSNPLGAAGGSAAQPMSAAATCDFFGAAPGSEFYVIDSTSGPVMYSRIALTDLAGSEKLKHSEAKGVALEEMKKINSSLTCLGNVIHNLFTGAKHIPYRDSKLTILLRSAFAAPNSKIVMIANVAPTACTLDETLSTLHFANKVKAMQVTDCISGDPQGEASYLLALRQCDELLADLRLSREKEEPGTQLCYCRIRTDGTLHGPLRTYLARGFADPNGSSADLKKKDREIRRIGTEASEALTAAREQRKLTAKADDDRERLDMVDDIVQQRRDDREDASKALRQLEVEEGQQRARAAEDEAARKAEIAAVEAIISPEEITRIANRIKSVKNEALPQAASDLTKLKGEFREIERRLMVDNKAEEDAWAAAWAKIDAAKNTHEAQRRFYNEFREYSEAHVGFIKARRQTFVSYVGATQAKKKAELDKMRAFSATLLHQIAAAAVGQAEARRQASSDSASPSRGEQDLQQCTEAQRSVYDSPTLVNDVVAYLESGTQLVKHGRSGRPKYKKFFLSVGTTSWLQWETGKGGGYRKVDLSTVTSIKLGQQTKIFRRSEGDTKSFYLSFTVWYTKKGRPRDLNLVADSEAEFEAWVIGLGVLTKLRPAFSEPKDLEGFRFADSLDDEERELCSQWHIPPKVFLMLATRVREERAAQLERAQKGGGDGANTTDDDGDTEKKGTVQPLALTVGELRYMTYVDVFRSAAMYAFFEGRARVKPKLSVKDVLRRLMSGHKGTREQANVTPQPA